MCFEMGGQFKSALMHKKSRFLCKETTFFNCDPNRIRTYDLQIRNLLLYPAELWDHATLFFAGARCKNPAKKENLIEFCNDCP